MKLTVNSQTFAECMRKIQPAVNVIKDKKEIVETTIQLTVTKAQKVEDRYVGIAVAFDSKKQLFCVFTAGDLEMEEDKKDLYISGKRLCDISNALDNGSDVPMTMSVDKNCIIKKGGSQIQLPLGEKPVIIYPGSDWIVRSVFDTKELQNLLFKGGRFYNPGAEDLTGDVCIRFDMEGNQIQMSSTDTYKLAFYEMAATYQFAQEEKRKEVKELLYQIEGEQMKVLSKFLSGKKTEVCVYEKYLFFKSDADIALFMVKDTGGKPYTLSNVIGAAKMHSKEKECTISARPKDLLGALTIFDVANQEAEPFVHITKDKNGNLSFETKGKTSKTLVPAKVEGDFKKLVLHSKILRQVLSSYDKDEAVLIYVGDPKEGVLFKENEDVPNFNMISKISV